jgi:sarcosine oxidase subunit alpha
MASFDFEGKRVPLQDGDTIASALYRAGVRTFTRSIKHHRRRGLYCLTGDCPNCMVNVDGEPGIRSCTTPARDGMRVKRESGLPSAELDLLSVTDRAHALMPVGFYYKTFIRPRFAWEIAERVIRGATGVGRLPVGREPRMKESRHVHTDVLVVGGGVAGLAAAAAAAGRGGSVILCDEGRLGEKVAPGPTMDRIRALEAELREQPSVTILERHTAVGIYEGPLVPVVGEEALLQVDPGRIVVATGAVESHAVFRGNDLPGIWLGRGAARLAGVHSLRPGRRAVVAAGTAEGLEHLRTLREAGVDVVAAVVPEALTGEVPAGVPVIRNGRVAKAEGRKEVRAAVVLTAEGPQRIECDAVVLSLGFAPRDALLRMGAGLPVAGAGEVVRPGCSLEEAVESGRKAGNGEPPEAQQAEPVRIGRRGYVCLCEDVSVADLEQAWSEGWRSSEILKRYTSATMGPCRGAMCGRLLSSFVAERSGSPETSALTTARPPVRPVPLEDLASGVHEVIEKRTALHERHLQLGARLDWSGSWKRPFDYGDVADEYRAVRERVSLMDVGTLGKFLVAGRDAMRLVDRVYPCRIENLAPGRSRYMLALDEAGYVMDDGMICAREDGTYYITSTSGGADRMEAWLRNWTDRWDLHVHVVNQTPMLGAINIAGPRARDLLSRLCNDPIDRESLPHMAHREITVAGVPCRAVRVGFVGELSFELHHPRSRSVELWDALMDAGRDLGIRPHGLDALEILRMEKGHFYLGQDTLPDDHPAKLGLSWAIAMDKPSFIGKVALERMAEIPIERRFVGLAFEGAVPGRGVPLYAGDRIVGRVTSCAESRVLQRAIGLGWLRAVDGEFPSALRAEGRPAKVVPIPFYDPEGARLRA